MPLPGMSSRDLVRDRDDRLGRLDGSAALMLAVEQRVEFSSAGDAQQMIRSATGRLRTARCFDARCASHPWTPRMRGRGGCRWRVRSSRSRAGACAPLQQLRVELRVTSDSRAASWVTTFLGGPAADPAEPRAVAVPEHAMDEPVVAGQVSSVRSRLEGPTCATPVSLGCSGSTAPGRSRDQADRG